MQTLFTEAKKRGLLGSGLGMVMSNTRYIFWFWLLNLTLAEFGTSGFRRAAHDILDHSLYADGLIHGFHANVLMELLQRPDFGHLNSMTTPALFFAFLFFVATAFLLPGVFAGYGSSYPLPREDFFRACGRNLWRFVRMMIIAGIVMGIAAGFLFAVDSQIVEKAGESTLEILPFAIRVIDLAMIFLVMTILRIWFDLAETDIVLGDQGAVRKSIAVAFRCTFGNIGRLLGSYVVATVVAAIILVAGLWICIKTVAPQRVWLAFAIYQVTLFLLLLPRFWQRGIAVSWWQTAVTVPTVAVQPIERPPVSIAVVSDGAPVVPESPPSTS